MGGGSSRAPPEQRRRRERTSLLCRVRHSLHSYEPRWFFMKYGSCTETRRQQSRPAVPAAARSQNLPSGRQRGRLLSPVQASRGQNAVGDPRERQPAGAAGVPPDTQVQLSGTRRCGRGSLLSATPRSSQGPRSPGPRRVFCPRQRCGTGWDPAGTGHLAGLGAPRAGSWPHPWGQFRAWMTAEARQRCPAAAPAEARGEEQSKRVKTKTHGDPGQCVQQLPGRTGTFHKARPQGRRLWPQAQSRPAGV